MEKKKGRIISSVGGLYTVRVFEDGTYSDVLMLPQKDGDLVDAVGTLSCHGVMREGALVVGDVTLTVGESLLVSGKGFELEFRVLSISEIR